MPDYHFLASEKQACQVRGDHSEPEEDGGISKSNWESQVVLLLKRLNLTGEEGYRRMAIRYRFRRLHEMGC